jgi:hypothetical protein
VNPYPWQLITHSKKEISMSQNDATKTVLSAEDIAAVKEKIEAPSCPTPALVEAMRKSQEAFGTGAQKS